MIGDAWGIQRPFEVAFCSFLLSTLYVRAAIPHIAAESVSGGSKPNSKGIAGFFAPLRVLAPQKILLNTGSVKSHYGVLFLCAGVFLGVVRFCRWISRVTKDILIVVSQLATGYAPLLIQMYATAIFEFQQGDNGLLMSGFAFMRAAFLIFLFPRIISKGRKWHLERNPVPEADESEPSSASLLALNPEELEAPMGSFAEEEPVRSSATKEDDGTAFDLFFLRVSLIVDGALTMCAAFATERWHIYLGELFCNMNSVAVGSTDNQQRPFCSLSPLVQPQLQRAL